MDASVQSAGNWASLKPTEAPNEASRAVEWSTVAIERARHPAMASCRTERRRIVNPDKSDGLQSSSLPLSCSARRRRARQSIRLDQLDSVTARFIRLPVTWSVGARSRQLCALDCLRSQAYVCQVVVVKFQATRLLFNHGHNKRLS